MIENALRETIQALEETKHVFKSKRLKELRQQLQGVLGVLEREKAAGVEPTPERRISTCASRQPISDRDARRLSSLALSMGLVR